MKIKKLEKRLEKVVLKEIGLGDGYLRIDTIIIDCDTDTNFITIKGAYGRRTYVCKEGEMIPDYDQSEFTLEFPDGSKPNFVAGMLYQIILNDPQF